MPKISVIVPVYRVEPYLDGCVRSVLRQTFSDFELILVDDGSPDRCGAMCDAWAKRDGRIRVFHKQNGGLSDARNYGIDRAKGEFLTFLDADDYAKDTYLSYLLSLFGYAPDCRVTACAHAILRGKAKEPVGAFSGVRVLSRREAFAEVLYHGAVDVSAWAKMYRREVFSSLRYPKGHLYEDTYVFGDVLKATPTLVLGGEVQYFYVQREGSIVNGGFHLRRAELIASVGRLCEAARAVDPSLEGACVRRLTHARLSVLRYMGRCDKKYRPLRTSLRKEVLAAAPAVLKNPKTPRRDRLAIYALRVGFGAFYTAWRIYGKWRA